jgi:hypothetical protein
MFYSFLNSFFGKLYSNILPKLKEEVNFTELFLLLPLLRYYGIIVGYIYLLSLNKFRYILENKKPKMYADKV